jgi:hypothetical protein
MCGFYSNSQIGNAVSVPVGRDHDVSAVSQGNGGTGKTRDWLAQQAVRNWRGASNSPFPMAALMMGVVKGSSVTSVVAATGLCVALVPLGVAVLRTPPTPPLRKLVGGAALAAGLVGTLFYVGQLG